MVKVSLDQAKEQLEALIEAALHGETVMISDNDKQVIQLVPVPQPVKFQRRAGSAKGLIFMSDDFDDPLPDFEEYM